MTYPCPFCGGEITPGTAHRCPEFGPARPEPGAFLWCVALPLTAAAVLMLVLS